eukprot:CAMPEP_0118690940 /NCGR_PEP_ID=MMETSP0800-20121206/10397_1 /TAXON_ID=210618 ORGANISM="Striatella unipunctata, Strain CCMP2910" /NCGR_SAMPLE_ID=MMETSP0800 /ASSEMBLY_ACC=CAM_ASM_000638 /LENGTH=106 /DNA_ID=CAMNT_0006588651 /DNA_START=18 /DNA_END=334 /DNA_ORIENTATION=+
MILLLPTATATTTTRRVIFFLSAILIFALSARAFVPPKPWATTAIPPQTRPKHSLPFLLHAQQDDDNKDVTTTPESSAGGLDAQGFGGYLLPYALAALASIAVTAA